MKTLFNEMSQEDNDIISQIIKMDSDFNNNPLYIQYEEKYLKNQLNETFSSSNLSPMGKVPDEMIDIFVNMIIQSATETNITPEMVINNRDYTIQHTITIWDMATEDDESNLVLNLSDYIELLQKLGLQ